VIQRCAASFIFDLLLTLTGGRDLIIPKLSDSADAHRVLPQKPKLESLNSG
jgi:hypothetical protein